ncbi:WD repeat-containing protein [Ceratobasidium sp. AG-Ba]|nr:WD repeat-containing protein [Ceratobasidium sp. AG-Ba]
MEKNKGRLLGWNGLRKFATTLNRSTARFDPLKTAVDEFSKSVEAVEEEGIQDHKGYEKVKRELDGSLTEIATQLNETVPTSMEPCIENVALNIQRIARELSRNHKRQLERVTSSTDSINVVLGCYRRVRALLAQLLLNNDSNVWRAANEQPMEDSSDKPSSDYVTSAWSSSSETLAHTGCAPNTYVNLIHQIEDWVYNGQGPRVYWLNGTAGTGKTTIAYTLCRRLKQSGGLAASFFCNRQLPACREVNLVLPNIAYQLSSLLPRFRYIISGTLQKKPRVCNQPLAEQLDKLVVRPLLEMKSTLPTDLVVIIDALDECSDDNAANNLVNALLEHAHELPIKFLVTSRPNRGMLDRMQNKHIEGVCLGLQVHELDSATVQENIKAYLQLELGRYATLSTGDLDILAQNSGMLFVYAATIVRYIVYGDFTRSGERIDTVLNTSSGQTSDSTHNIDKLYNTILIATFGDKALKQKEKKLMIILLHTVVCAKEPLTVQVLASLLASKKTKPVYDALRLLQSVLYLALGGMGGFPAERCDSHFWEGLNNAGRCPSAFLLMNSRESPAVIMSSSEHRPYGEQPGFSGGEVPGASRTAKPE